MTTSDDTARTFGERYVLGNRLTQSETREVWRAHDDIVSRAVALKIFFGAGADDPAWRDAFRLDAAKLAALSHPGIAKVYEHGESSTETWIAMAFINGASLADRLASGPELSSAEAVEIIGQAALALGAAHDAGIAHGAMSPAALMIRPDGVGSIIGWAVGSRASQAGDLIALGNLSTELLDTAGPPPGEQASAVAQFRSWVANREHRNPPRDSKEIGRTALALAAALAGTEAPAAAPRSTPLTAMEETPDAAPRYDEAERKMVRNRLLVLGTIVVVGGAALLRFVGQGAGDVTVPDVTSIPLNQAKLELTQDGLRSSENVPLARGTATVLSQSPAAGTQVKAGSSVSLTVTDVTQ